jgi:hypothetical protein
MMCEVAGPNGYVQCPQYWPDGETQKWEEGTKITKLQETQISEFIVERII